MAHTYPRIGRTRKEFIRGAFKDKSKCVQCEKKLSLGEEIVAVRIEYTYMRGEDEIECVCVKCSKQIDLTKILKNIGFSEPDHRYEWPPKAVGQAVKSRRMQNAEAEYEQARVYAEAYGISLKRFSDIHYQIHDLSKDVVINLYPSNQRIYADKKHKNPPFIKLQHAWRLMDVVKGYIEVRPQ